MATNDKRIKLGQNLGGRYSLPPGLGEEGGEILNKLPNKTPETRCLGLTDIS